MYVNGVILPTEPLIDLPTNLADDPTLALKPVAAKTYLDWQVYQLRSIRKDPIIVLGPDGDDMLRAVPKLADRKLTFSRKSSRTILEQIKLGLQGAGTCAFYLPLHVPTPAPIVWSELEKALSQMPYNGGPHVFQPEFNGKRGYPLLITPEGKDWLEDQSPEGDFFRLSELLIQTVPVNSETTLQELRSIDEFEEWKSLYTA